MPKVCIAALVAQLYYETGSEILVEDCFASRNTQITNIAHHHCQLDIIQLKNRIILQITTDHCDDCLLYTSPSPRDRQKSRMPSSA